MRVKPATERGRLRLAVVTVGVLDLAAIFLGTYPRTAKWFNVAWSIGSLGVITFLGVLMVENYIGSIQNVQRTEVRNAIASTFMIVYFALLGLVLFKGTNASANPLAKSLVGNFTYLFGIVIVFYFGSKAVTDYVKLQGGGGQQGQTGAASPEPSSPSTE